MATGFRSYVWLAALTAASLCAVEIGDTHDEVVAEKGPPAGKMEAGGALVLKYSDQTITLRDGKVVAIKTAPGVKPGAAAAKPSGKPAQPPQPAKAVWLTDYAAALERAKAENRKVFLFFTGSDWCGWCMRLDQEILTTPEFIDYAAQDLILVKLDFPRRTKLPAGVLAQNEKLAQRYAVRGYPTVVVLNSEGKAVQRLGYQEGGPGPFVEKLRKL
jgi:protein disulfide-isomerase